MQTNELQAKMNKQVGISLEALNWFILHSFLKSIIEDPEKVKLVFKDAEDCQVIEGLLLRITKQFAPRLNEALEAEEDSMNLENILKISPKKLILPKGADIIV